MGQKTSSLSDSNTQDPEKLTKAKEVIAQAVLTGSQSLSMSHLSLRILPEEIYTFSSLQQLDISHNDICQALPHIITRFAITGHTALCSIRLNGNNLSGLASATSQHVLPSVTSIDLSNCRLDGLPHAILSAVPNLRSLELGYNKLERLQGSHLCVLTRLEELSLRSNLLIDVPMYEMGQALTALTSLNLLNNAVNDESFSVTRPGSHSENPVLFPSLKGLKLHSNKLTVIPQMLLTITSLESLDFGNNSISLTTSSLQSVNFSTLGAKLTELSLDYNRIEVLPADLGSQLPNLESLFLSCNALTSLPESLHLCTRLQTLRAANNKITHLPEAGLPQSLKQLVLGFNKIKHIPDYLYSLHSLEAVDLRSNQIAQLHDTAITGLTSLVSLNLDLNLICTIPEAITALTRLKVLALNDNGVESIPESISPHPTFKATISHTIDPPNEIVDHVYLGSRRAAGNLYLLRRLGITHVLTVANDIEPIFTEEIQYKVVTIEDDSGENLLQHFNSCITYIGYSLTQAADDGRQTKVLVHCAAGVSRSASVVTAYVMKTLGLSATDALNHVRSRRSIICPNRGFLSQLDEFEGILRSQKDRQE